MNKEYTFKCNGVDMVTGFRDCWNFSCEKNHTWRYYEIHTQPERSKREDLDCCNNVDGLERAFADIHYEYCSDENNHYGQSCVFLKKLIAEYKMRCSEHCGNTMRTK